MRLSPLGMPRPIRAEDYGRAIAALGESLKSRREVIALYQVGSVTTPGISDIDLLAVLEDGATCRADSLRDLPPADRSLFTHELYGLSRSHYERMKPFARFVRRHPLWGEDLGAEEGTVAREGSEELNAQIALEYLVRICMGLTVEWSYGVIKVRSLLLHARKMLIDLELLGHSHGELLTQLRTLARIRDRWFTEESSRRELPALADALFQELNAFLKAAFHTRPLFVPAGGNLSVAPNIRIEPGDGYSWRRTGVVLPSLLRRLGKKYVNLQNRFNYFVFQVPVESDVIPDPILRRHRLLEEIHEYNRVHLPAFSPFAYGLPLFAGAPRPR